eukprot:m.8749 g.8749  ORF g.8749 m.8749 type:complete len:111 (-) comp3241_c0_seq2:194-526(-)
MKQKRGVVIITAVVVVGVVGVAVGWLLKMKEEGCEERRRRENEERKVHLIMELRNVDDQKGNDCNDDMNDSDGVKHSVKKLHLLLGMREIVHEMEVFEAQGLGKEDPTPQ